MAENTVDVIVMVLPVMVEKITVLLIILEPTRVVAFSVLPNNVEMEMLDPTISDVVRVHPCRVEKRSEETFIVLPVILDIEPELITMLETVMVERRTVLVHNVE